MLPDEVPAGYHGALLTLEREMPVGDYPVIAFSVAYELEIAGVVDCGHIRSLRQVADDLARVVIPARHVLGIPTWRRIPPTLRRNTSKPARVENTDNAS